MKKICYSIISIVLVVFVGCTPSKQEQEKQKQQAVQDSIAAVEASKSPILKEFEKAKKNGEITLSTFLQIGCIADRIKSDYGENYFNFLLQCLKDYTKPISVLSPDEDHYYIDAMPSYNNAETYISIYYDNSNNSLNANIRIADYIVNTDGGFTLEEGSKWEVKWLEYDEFGDPIKDKVFIAVYNDDLNYMNSTYIAVMKGDENHVRFYYDLPWYPGRFDNNKILSIKIKNKNDGTVRELSNYKYNTKYCILSEEDSRYIKEMCDSNPQISFCIRYEVISYDWFPDSDDIEVCTIDFDNGLAYGLNNAIMAYFYRVF
ncbi:hypothetical protein [Phocaeicola coprophilus]|jgi:hypothetical protein|uniref:hypothetical protein n=1 Tax=Phocaeicola coprophilus TaxID=387090 RepID=UPI0026DA85E2|nr:hypothetical protein [Phocaeicola coprophilus]